jgi:hypothetical protein
MTRWEIIEEQAFLPMPVSQDVGFEDNSRLTIPSDDSGLTNTSCAFYGVYVV